MGPNFTTAGVILGFILTGGLGRPPLRNITKMIVGGDALIAPQQRLDRRSSLCFIQ